MELKLQKRYKYAGDIYDALVEKAGFPLDVAAYFCNGIKDAKVVEQEWIPVTERLPEEWTEVLVFARCRPDADGFVQTAVYIGIPGYWRVMWNNCMLEYNIVTHWMPLPDAPKEEHNG